MLPPHWSTFGWNYPYLAFLSKVTLNSSASSPFWKACGQPEVLKPPTSQSSLVFLGLLCDVAWCVLERHSTSEFYLLCWFQQECPHLVPGRQQCLGRFQRWGIDPGKCVTGTGFEDLCPHHLQFTVSTFCLRLGLWALSFLPQSPCLRFAALTGTYPSVTQI